MIVYLNETHSSLNLQIYTSSSQNSRSATFLSFFQVILLKRHLYTKCATTWLIIFLDDCQSSFNYTKTDFSSLDPNNNLSRYYSTFSTFTRNLGSIVNKIAF